ncbi:hypothetical protein [Flagellimonas aequoris]|uniref:hypothetical protein n=1 Tax=Flagellimonas aequoris TaxID=2306997 RepID=UPI001F2558C3|nr:hypothetical protein [Allomuricauda aequoris]
MEPKFWHRPLVRKPMATIMITTTIHTVTPTATIMVITITTMSTPMTIIMDIITITTIMIMTIIIKRYWRWSVTFYNRMRSWRPETGGILMPKASLPLIW